MTASDWNIEIFELQEEIGVDLPLLLRCKRIHEHRDTKKLTENPRKAGHKVGAAWCEGQTGTSVVVKPKFDHLKPVDMLLEAWSEVQVFEAADTKNCVFKLDLEKGHPIPLKKSEAEPFLLFFVARYLQEIHPLLPRMRKRDYHSQQENLRERVRGRLLVPQHIHHNLAQGRHDRAFCEFGVFDEHNPLNQILKGALLRSREILSALPKESRRPLNHQLSTSLRQLESIRPETGPDPVQILRARRSAHGVFAPFRPALDLALYILGIKQNSVSLDKANDSGNGFAVPPFAIDMERLFELYVRALVLKSLPTGWTHAVDPGDKKPIDVIPRKVFDPKYRIPCRQPDLLLSNGTNRFVVEVKYRGSDRYGNWYSQFSSAEEPDNSGGNNIYREDLRHDFFQTVAYMLLFSAPNAAIVFPSSTDSKTVSGALGYDGVRPNRLSFVSVGPKSNFPSDVLALIRGDESQTRRVFSTPPATSDYP